jgi:hypothetical protein
LIEVGCTLNEPNLPALFAAENIGFVNPVTSQFGRRLVSALGVEPGIKPIFFSARKQLSSDGSGSPPGNWAMKGAGATVSAGLDPRYAGCPAAR